jgi:phosphoglycolate phosphatase
MLDDHGHPRRPLEVFPKYIGEGMRHLVRRALPEDHRADDYVDRCVADYMRHYDRCWHDQTRAYAGMSGALAALKRRGMRLAVLSNKPHRFTVLCCDHFFAPGTFEVVFGQREGVPRKPDPAAGFEIAALLGLAPERCAYAGDSGLDMQFGKAAGMRRVGVLWGFRDEAELLENGAELLVKSPSDLANL